MNRQILSINIFIILLACACQKDRNIYIYGIWNVEYYYINGTDYTQNLKSDPCYEPLDFRSPENSLTSENLYGLTDGLNGCATSGGYEVQNDGENLAFFFYNCGWQPLGKFGRLGPGKKWEIKKFTSGQLWIELNENDSTEWIHFIKI